MYYVTICTFNRECLFGEIVGGSMKLNELGEIAVRHWNNVQEHLPSVKLDQWVIMPNHMHGIIYIVGAGSPRPINGITPTESSLLGAETTPLQRYLLGQIIAFFKYQSTKHINQSRQTPGIPIWQRNYYDHIIRTDRSLDQIREYIQNNPARWHLDRNHPANIQKFRNLIT